MVYKLSSLTNKSEQEKQAKRQEQLLHMDYFKSLCLIDDDTQNLVLNSVDNEYIVIGPAGSGKTILALSKMYQLELHNNDYRIIIFTRALKEFLKGKMKVANFSNLDKKLFYLNEYETLLEKDLISKGTEYIIIDEVQDFSYNDLSLYTQSTSKGFFLYGDKKQNIHPRRTGSMDVLGEFENNVQLKSYVLNKIFRFSDSLFSFANCINQNNQDVACHILDDGHEDSFEKPIIMEFDNYHNELNYIKEAISKPEFTDVGILVRNNIHAKKVHEWLLNNYDGDIDAKYEYWDNGVMKEYYKLDFSSSAPKILTYHSAKGLEFDRVFLPFCNVEKEFSYNDATMGYNYREALYVAFTRAKKSLIISYNYTKESKDKLQYKKISGKSPFIEEIKKNTYLFKKVGG